MTDDISPCLTSVFNGKTELKKEEGKPGITSKVVKSDISLRSYDYLRLGCKRSMIAKRDACST